MATVRELLECANINLQENGAIGLLIGKNQLKEALELIDQGKDLCDETEEE